MHDDTTQRKTFMLMVIAIILGTALGRFVGAVTHHAALGFIAVVVFELLSFSLIFLRLRHR